MISVPGPISSGEIAASAITTAKINTSAVTTAKIAESAVTASKIKALAVGTSELAACAVTTAKINDSAVTTAKIAESAVTASKIKALAVGTSELAACAVTTAKINDSGITAAKINTSAVITAKIAATAVTAAKIGVSAVTTSKIAESAVTASKIKALAVGTSELAASAITTTKINTGAVTIEKLSLNEYDTIYIDAAAMVPCTTNPALQSTHEYGTNDIDSDLFAFDAGATEERVQFKNVMPDNWDRSTIKAKFYWSSDTGSTAGDTVEFGIKAGALSDNDAIDAALGTPQVISDTLLANNGTDLQISPATPAITVGGTPALGDATIFEVYRNTDGVDDMAEDAWLMGVSIQYKKTTNVAAW
jgi:hypothetical protein